jgi:hypothetical protein
MPPALTTVTQQSARRRRAESAVTIFIDPKVAARGI